jgi:hypothetical protein
MATRPIEINEPFAGRRRGGGVGAAALCGGGQGDALIINVPGNRD